VCDKAGFFGNGDLKTAGEKIAVSPFDSDFVVAGSLIHGLWASHDQGETWAYVGLKGNPIAFVAFNPYIKDRLYIAIASSEKISNRDYFTRDSLVIANSKLLLSTDNGSSFQTIFDKQIVDFSTLIFSPTTPKCIMAVSPKNGILRSMDEGKNFESINNGFPPGSSVAFAAISPQNPSVFFAVLQQLPPRFHHYDNVTDVPVYKSVDAGNTWALVRDYAEADFKNYPVYIKDKQWIGWEISRIMVDEKNEKKLYMSNWYGVSVSEDGGKTWNGNFFKGIENACIENIVADRLTPGKAYFVLPDHYPMYTVDTGKNYKQLYDTSKFLNSTALVTSKFKKGVIVYAAKDEWNPETSVIMTSGNDGKSFKKAIVFDQKMTVQALREDEFIPGVFYAYIDRSIAAGAGLYKSTDWGTSWKKMNLPMPAYIKTFPYRAEWIEDELLSVTKGQTKNVCGTNQLLCIDPAKKNTIYFGEWTEGIWRTDNDGESWTNISRGLPFHNDTATTLVDIKADYNNDGVLYAGFVREGLWRSDNRGETWQKIYPLDNTIFNASSTVIAGNKGNEIYIASEYLYWSPSPSAIMYSNDKGKTFTNIYDGRFGALRCKNTGTLYGVTSGNGAFYTTIKK
jgi:hypothetical protein